MGYVFKSTNPVMTQKVPFQKLLLHILLILTPLLSYSQRELGEMFGELLMDLAMDNLEKQGQKNNQKDMKIHYLLFLAVAV